MYRITPWDRRENLGGQLGPARGEGGSPDRDARPPGGRHRATALAALLTLAAGCAPAVPEVASPDDGNIPRPQPVSTGSYQVGVYYFPGWPSREKWQVLAAFPERTPLLGYYREGDPDVMDWQIKWAVEHGISFFAFDWYWDRRQRQIEHALLESYLRARFRSFIKFCLLWANHNPPGSSSAADLTHARGLLDRSVLPPARVLHPRRQAGGDPLLPGAAPGGHGLRGRGRGHSPYNYPRAGMQDGAAREAPYDSAVDHYERICAEMAGARFLTTSR